MNGTPVSALHIISLIGSPLGNVAETRSCFGTHVDVLPTE